MVEMDILSAVIKELAKSIKASQTRENTQMRAWY